MKKIKTDFKNILNNQRGVALMMIMTSIIILMAIYGEFTFESKISRIKATNILDRSQAKLLADSGMQLALARLRLYKEAYNRIQGNPTAKSSVSPQLLNQLWEVPFMFPIPVAKNATVAFKDTVSKFEEESLLDGQMSVSIQNVSNRLNLNLLRVDVTKLDPNDPSKNDTSSILNTSDTAIQEDVSVDQTLFFLMKRLVDQKKETDEGFEERYGDINYQELITNLKYFMSDFQSMANDPLAGEAESTFQRLPLTPKYGPLGSASELYAIPGWDDELIELIQNEFSVYPTTQIDLNKMTANMLRILIPNINEDEIREFFEYVNDKENPKFFNTLEDFKKYVVDQGLMGKSQVDARMQLFLDKGISFGSNPNLFRVVSAGTYNRSTYTLVAYVVLPKQEVQQPTTQPPTTQPPTTQPPATTTPEQPAQLLDPKVIEIQIN